MSFNALSIAKLGVGFGAIAVASIGLLTPSTGVISAGGSGINRLHHSYVQTQVVEKATFSHVDDDELLVLVMQMLGEIL